MANRRRIRNPYRAMESIMVKVLTGDALLFFLYMFAASRLGFWEYIKGISAFLCFMISALTLVWLYLKQEFTRRRSLWMVTACIAILTCLLVSLLLGYPCPSVVAALPK